MKRKYSGGATEFTRVIPPRVLLIIKMRKVRMTTRQIANCFAVSYQNICQLLERWGDNEVKALNLYRIGICANPTVCIICQKILQDKRRKTCSKKCLNKYLRDIKVTEIEERIGPKAIELRKQGYFWREISDMVGTNCASHVQQIVRRYAHKKGIDVSWAFPGVDWKKGRKNGDRFVPPPNIVNTRIDNWENS